MTKVEDVARALLQHQIDTGQCEPDIPWSSFVGEARAAIKAFTALGIAAGGYRFEFGPGDYDPMQRS